MGSPWGRLQALLGAPFRLLARLMSPKEHQSGRAEALSGTRPRASHSGGPFLGSGGQQLQTVVGPPLAAPNLYGPQHASRRPPEDQRRSRSSTEAHAGRINQLAGAPKLAGWPTFVPHPLDPMHSSALASPSCARQAAFSKLRSRRAPFAETARREQRGKRPPKLVCAGPIVC